MAQIDRSEGLVGNTAFKAPCRAATTANITLSAEQTIDGIACVDGDRILVKNQTTGSENGIWVVSTGSWNRSDDCDGSYDVTTGTMVRVTSGTTNANSVWKLDTTGTITIGSSTLTFTAASVGFDAQGMADFIHVATNKTTPVGADEVGIWDSVSGLLNRVSFTNLLNWFAAKAGSASQAFAASNIVFPATQVPSADANTLDDYEEGTFTATLTGETDPPTTPITATARYTKIGRKVTVDINFSNVNTTGATGFLKVTGLPFTSAATYVAHGACSSVGMTILAVVAQLSGGASAVYFVDSTDQSPINISAGASKSLRASLTYCV